VPAVQDALQQSLSNWHISVVSAQPQSALTHWREQQSVGLTHAAPSRLHVLATPHVSEFGSQTSAPQQSMLVAQLSPKFAHPQTPLTHWSEQHSDGSKHDVPSTLQLLVHVLLFGSQRRVPQHSLLSVQEAPTSWQAQVPVFVSHRRAPQQSALFEQEPPMFAQAHVWLVESRRRAPQQSPLFAHVSPENAQPHVPLTHWKSQQSFADVHDRPSSLQLPPPPASEPPAPASGLGGLAHLPLVHRRAPQHSTSKTQSAPWPAHAGAQKLPNAQ
jgi:hypothetical protein